MSSLTFKQLILARYCGQFLPATDETASVHKTSEDIVMNLRPMADFTTNDIAEHLAGMGYTIGFDGDTPVWLMKTEPTNELKE